jgi:hypothetical protein
MRNISYAERISDAQVLVSGLRANSTQLMRRGLDMPFIDSLEMSRAAAATLNDQQEKLKADLKSKTAELEAKLAEIDSQMTEAKKIVKLDFPQSQWKEFGIEDKR